MESALGDVTELLRDGALILLKYAFLYVFLPDIIAIVVFGLILKVRGMKFALIVGGLTILFILAFVWYGMPAMNEEITNLSKSL